MKHFLSRCRYIWNHTRKGRVIAVALVLFGLANVFVYVQYRDRTYPRASINGRPVGDTAYGQLGERIDRLDLLPATVELRYAGKSTAVDPRKLGVSIDSRQTAKVLAEQRFWLPVANLMVHRSVQPAINIEPRAYDQAINDIGKQYRRPAQDASLQLRSNAFVLTPEVNAVSIDVSGSQARIVEALSSGTRTADLMMRQTAPPVTKASLTARFDKLEARRKAAITLTFQTKTRTFTPQDVGSWFVPQTTAPEGYSIDIGKVDNAVSDAGLELGVNVTNNGAAAAQVKLAAEAAASRKIALEGRPLGQRTYSYCTAGRGVPQADVDGMSAIIDSTLNAKKGWSLSNNIRFVRSTTDCSFTIWLAAPDQMTSFGAICDAYWSCAVTPNVIFNWDRWRYTSEPWKKAGGTLDDYRVMVINHEVGHWLGFGHSNCPVQGQPAPVMQQQSIDLQGCVFNPWPTATERTTLKNYLGL